MKWVLWILSIICDKCGRDNDVVFKEVESIEILQILRLIINVNGKLYCVT